jgi:hypothetical protein
MEFVISHPKKEGINILFRKYYDDNTAIEMACKKFGCEEVMKVVEGALISSYLGNTPINIAEVLITAAIDENMHLDCVYFLLRREPDVLQRLLSSALAAPSAVSAPAIFYIVDALLTASIDENFHLDCVYYLVRSQPDVLVKLLSHSSPSAAVASIRNSNNNNNNDNDKNTGTSSDLTKDI